MKQVIAAIFNAITVTNHITQATIILDSNVAPVYMVFSLHNPERIVIDFFKNYSFRNNILPMSFNDNNLIKCVRTSTPVKPQSMRIVVDLAYASTIEVVAQKQIEKNYRFILTFSKKKIFVMPDDVYCRTVSPTIYPKTRFVKINNRAISNKKNNVITSIQRSSNTTKNNNQNQSSLIVVAIDAGHGGQDPGATGYNGIYEKNITINIAKKLKKLLDLDPIFSAVMTRDGDYFLSVMERSDIARKKGASVLISIHADSALNTNVKGASVWVLSNRRAESEMVYLLKRSDKCSELLGGLGYVLTNYHNDPYFNHFILNLQFGYSQKVGYDIAMCVLHQLKSINTLHKDLPEYSNFGVLRSPDIPSLLVEIGFISNKKEIHLLSSSKYQEKIANALYKGLRAYFITTQSKKPLNSYFRTKNAYIIAAS